MSSKPNRPSTAKRGRLLARLQAMQSIDSLIDKTNKSDELECDIQTIKTETPIDTKKEIDAQASEIPIQRCVSHVTIIDQPLKYKKLNTTLNSKSTTIKRGRLKKIDQELHPELYSTKPSNKSTSNTLQKNYSCSTCQKSFTRKEKMQIHERTHMSREQREALKEFQCDYCPKRFQDMTKLKSHRDFKHLKEYKHICQVCDKPFVNFSELKKHLTFSHAEKKPCIICGKNVLNIDNHIKEVHDSNPRTCSYCGETFANPKKLNKHRYTKHPFQQYECRYCEKIFAEKFHFKKHLLEKHDSVLEFD